MGSDMRPSRPRTRRVALAGALACCVLATSCGSEEPVAQSDTGVTQPTVIQSADRTEALEMSTWIRSGVWRDVVAPAYEANHPGVTLDVNELQPEEFRLIVDDELPNGTGPDLITCRSFAPSLELFDAGALVDVTNLAEEHDLTPLQRAPFSTYDGARMFCVPVAAVVNALAFNTEILDELGLRVPRTTGEVLDVLRAVADDGRYEPISLGFATSRRAIILFWNGIGPAFWDGEDGRLGLISGTLTLQSPQFTEFLEFAAEVGTTLTEDPRRVSRDDALARFADGRTAMMPIGSWDTDMLATTDFEYALTPTLPREEGGPCYAVYHPDFGVGVNPAGNVPEATRFAEWVLSQEFADLYFPLEPGHLSLVHDVQPAPDRPPEFEQWLGECELTGRLFDQVLHDTNETLLSEAGEIVAAVVAGELTPDDAADQLDAMLQAIGASD